VVVEVVQHARRDHGERLVEVDEPADLRAVEDRLRVPQVGREDQRGRVVAEQRASVGQHERVVVDVDDTHGRVDVARDLVDVADGGEAGAEVDELPDTGVGHEEADGPAELVAVVVGEPAQLRDDLVRRGDRHPVDLEMLLAPEEVVVYTGDRRPAQVHARRQVRGSPVVPAGARRRPVHCHASPRPGLARP
jgi:hypothetical protein